MENNYFEESRIILGDSLEIMKQYQKCFDCCITDPPYGTNYKKVIGDENIETFKKSLSLIYNSLKDKTFFITYCYPLYVPEIIQEAKRIGFIYRWIGFNYYPNMFKQKPQPLGYNRYDLFLIFSKGDAKKRGYIKDTIHILMDKSNSKERGHPHQKPEKAFEKLIKATTNENDIILDPFFGSGNLGLVASRMNRKFIGIEIDEKFYQLAKQRYEEFLKK